MHWSKRWVSRRGRDSSVGQQSAVCYLRHINNSQANNCNKEEIRYASFIANFTTKIRRERKREGGREKEKAGA